MPLQNGACVACQQRTLGRWAPGLSTAVASMPFRPANNFVVARIFGCRGKSGSALATPRTRLLSISTSDAGTALAFRPAMGQLASGGNWVDRTGEVGRLRLAIEASRDVIFMTDANGVITYVNPEFVRVYGYEESDVVGRATPRILKSGTTVAADYDTFWRELMQGLSIRREFVNRSKAGHLLTVDCCATPIVDEAGEVTGFVSVQRDVTERKDLEEKLRVSEQRYRTLATAAQDHIFIVNRAAQIEYVNGAAVMAFGLTVDQVLGKRLDEVFPPDTVETIWPQVLQVLSTGCRQLFENRFHAPTGDLWLEAWIVPLQEAGASPHAVMGVARDVTERKLLEQQFLQAQKMEAVGRLAGGIAHDFNNLLTAILGYSQFLREAFVDVPSAVADVNEIIRAGERASHLTRQLLAFSRKQPVDRRLLDANAVVLDLQKMLKRIVGEDIELCVAVATGACSMVADAGQVEQLLLNLVVNSRDAMPAGGRLTIEVGTAQLDTVFAATHRGALVGSYVSIAVRDTGCGMTPEVLAHVFEPFFTTKPRGTGTGLGLSTVYGIVKQNDGYVTLESEPGRGTSAVIYWPLSAQPGSRTALAHAPARALPGQETILLVEDEAGIRSLMRRTLESYGYRILEASDGAAAVAIEAQHDGPIDLLLSDVIMPGLNGPDLAQHLVVKRPRLKVLHVSGFPNAQSIGGSPRERASFLAKPFTPMALAMKVRDCLDTL